MAIPRRISLPPNQSNRRDSFYFILFLMVVLAACRGRPLESASQDREPTDRTPAAVDPLVEGDVPYQSMLGFDSIRPIYKPQFLPAAEAPYQGDELVIGVARGKEAKAYSITVLRVREMVNDELAGLPILVTW